LVSFGVAARGGVVWGKVRLVLDPEIELKRGGSSADLQEASGTIAGRWVSRSVEWW
jgi:hypothetical protein